MGALASKKRLQFGEVRHLLPSIDVGCVDEAGQTAKEALNGRANADAGFVALFIDFLREMKEREEDAEDGKSVKSFESALEEQLV